MPDNHYHGGCRFGAGDDYVYLSKEGLRLYGDATCWDDLMVPGTSVRVGAIAPDLEGGFGGNSNLFLYQFDGVNTVEEVHFSIQMPHCWKEGSTIYPHVHFAPVSTNSSDTNQRRVRFSLEYTWANINSTFGAASILQLDSDLFVPNTSQWRHLLAKNSSGISGLNRNLSSMLLCRLYRDPADSADTYPQDAAFLQFDIHYEIDSLGSEGEYTKS